MHNNNGYMHSESRYYNNFDNNAQFGIQYAGGDGSFQR